MKYYNFIIPLLLLSFACKKGISVEEPLLEITSQTINIKTGDTAVFNIHGSADFISFYSGEILNDYTYIDGRVISAGITELSFDTYKCCAAQTQQDQLKVVLSTDFNGKYSINDIRQAKWEDITENYDLANAENSWKPAGIADISAKIEEGKPLYIVFKYTARPTSEAGVGKIWKIRNLLLNNKTEIGSTTLANLTNAGWQLLYDENGVDDPSRNFIVSSALSFRANAAPKDNVYHEVWIISKGFYIGKTDMGPDKAIPVKSYTESWVPVWSHIYKSPGEYTVTFVGVNNNLYDTKKVIKRLQIKVEP